MRKASNIKFVFMIDEKNITVAEHNGLIIINQHNISDNTVIMSSPLSKCMEKKNCTSCIEKDISLQVMYNNFSLTYNITKAIKNCMEY